MSLSRRQFLATSSVLAAGAGLSKFCQTVALAAPNADQPGAADPSLAVVEVAGGNDGLSTAIPFKDPAYEKARPKLKQPADKIIKINDELGLHPSMTGFGRLLEKSQLGVIQGVGYPNPNRSHFVSMDIWQTASFDPDEPYGWLGRVVE